MGTILVTCVVYAEGLHFKSDSTSVYFVVVDLFMLLCVGRLKVLPHYNEVKYTYQILYQFQCDTASSLNVISSS